MVTRTMMVGLALTLCVVCAGCSSTPNRQATHPDAPPIEAKSPQAKASFDAALALLKAGEWAGAEEGFLLVQSEHPGDPIAEVAELYIARAKLGDLGAGESGALALAATAGEIQQAAVLLEGLSSDSGVDDRVRYAARIYLALTRVAVGGGAKGVKVLEDYPGASISGIVLGRDALHAWAALTEAFTRANRHADVLVAAATLSERALALVDAAARGEVPESQAASSHALALYASARAFEAAPGVDDTALHTTFLQDERALARAAAGWAILSPSLGGEVSEEQRDALEAIYAVTSSALVQSGELERAAELSSLMATSGGPSRLVVGLLAPLSGPNAAVGARVMRGALLAQRVFEPNARPRFTVLALDSAATASDNIAALQRAGAVAAVGPIDKALVPTYAPLMRGAQIPMIALSTETLPEAEGEEGTWVFRNFISVEAEARAAAQVAVRRFGDTRLAVVFPEIGYGKLAARVFTEHATSLGATVVASRGYDRGATDHTIHARAIAKARPQAVFIPDTGGKVAEVTAFMAREGVWGARAGAPAADKKRTYVHYLGTSLWRDRAISGLTASYVDGAVFPVWFGESVGGDETRAFEEAHQRAFGAQASLYEAFTYDAFSWLRQIVLDEGMRRGASVGGALARESGFQGLTGAVRFRPWGEADRDLRFVRVTGQGFEAMPFIEAVLARGEVADESEPAAVE